MGVTRMVATAIRYFLEISTKVFLNYNCILSFLQKVITTRESTQINIKLEYIRLLAIKRLYGSRCIYKKIHYY